MLLSRSLGGIGRLYCDELLIGEVYYNIRRGQLSGELVCSVVFVGSDVELANNNCSYRLLIEDGRYLTVTLHRDRSLSPYSGSFQNGMLHAALAMPHPPA